MKIVVDTEASGPCPLFGDVISIGAVVVEPGLNRGFRSPDMRPMFDKYVEGAYKSISLTREVHMSYTATYEDGFTAFREWLDGLERKPGERLTLLSDNPSFDWQWINFGFHLVFGENPFGHSARRIGDMWAGLTGSENDHSKWKRFRRTAHTHDPLDDAKGNAEAYQHIWADYRERNPARPRR